MDDERLQSMLESERMKCMIELISLMDDQGNVRSPSNSPAFDTMLRRIENLDIHSMAHVMGNGFLLRNRTIGMGRSMGLDTPYVSSQNLNQRSSSDLANEFETYRQEMVPYLDLSLLPDLPHILLRDTPPVRRGSPSVRRGSPSVRRNTSSVHRDTSSVSRDTSSVRDDTPSVRLGSPSVRLGSPSVRLGSPSVLRGSPSVRRGFPSVRRNTSSVSRDTSSVRDDTPFVRRDTPSVHRDTSFVSRDTSSVRDDTPSVRRGSLSVRRGSPSVRRGSPSVRRNTRGLTRVGPPRVRCVPIFRHDPRRGTRRGALHVHHDTQQNMISPGLPPDRPVNTAYRTSLFNPPLISPPISRANTARRARPFVSRIVSVNRNDFGPVHHGDSPESPPPSEQTSTTDNIRSSTPVQEDTSSHDESRDSVRLFEALFPKAMALYEEIINGHSVLPPDRADIPSSRFDVPSSRSDSTYTFNDTEPMYGGRIRSISHFATPVLGGTQPYHHATAAIYHRTGADQHGTAPVIRLHHYNRPGAVMKRQWTSSSRPETMTCGHGGPSTSHHRTNTTAATGSAQPSTSAGPSGRHSPESWYIVNHPRALENNDPTAPSQETDRATATQRSGIPIETIARVKRGKYMMRLLNRAKREAKKNGVISGTTCGHQHGSVQSPIPYVYPPDYSESHLHTTVPYPSSDSDYSNDPEIEYEDM